MRRLLVIIFLLAISAAVVWTLFRWNQSSTAVVDPWSAVPQQSAIIVELPDALATWDQFTHTSQHWSSLEHLPSVAAVGRLLAQVITRAENDALLRESLRGVPVLASVMRTGGEQADLLLAFVPKAVDDVQMHTMAEVLKVNETALHNLKNGGTVQCRPDTALPILSLHVQQGIWLLATSSAMMDEALLQLKSGSPITNEPLLQEARSTLGGGAQAHVLVHLERTKSLMHTWWKPTMIDTQDVPTGWAALDLQARPDAFLLSGLIVPDTAQAMLTALAHQGTGRNYLERYLPLEVTAWDVQRIQDGEGYLRDLGVATDSAISTLAPNLFNWVHGEMGLAHAADTGAAHVATWAFFQTDDPEGAAEELRKPCPDGVHCDTLNHRGLRLTRLALMHAHEQLLGATYASLAQPWWCVLGDVVVFAPTSEALRTAIDAWNDGHTLAEDARTNAWSERIASTAGRTLRWDVARHWPHFGTGLKAGTSSAYHAASATWQQFGGLAVQLSPAQHGRTHVIIGLQHAPMEQRSTGIRWSTPLPPGITRKPDIVRNHTNNTREVLVQDGDHRIYLLGSSGKMLWKYPLDGPILGEVHQIDRFKNGKLQLLFNTAGHVYLIDRNGKDVGGFPIALPEKATAPLAVFDYEGTNEYRLLLVLADGRILNYGIEGSITTGWDAPRLARPTINAVRHLRIKNTDHLLVVDGNGKLNLLDRRGSERNRVALNIGTGANVKHVVPGIELNSTRVIWADTSGALHQAMLNGEGQTLSPPGYNTLGPIGDDGTFEIIRVRADSLVVARGSREMMIRSFGTTLALDVSRYPLNSGTVYAVVLPEREQVTLVDDSGRELDGFPLRGATLFSIADLDLDGTLELVTVTADGHVVAYNALPPQASR